MAVLVIEEITEELRSKHVRIRKLGWEIPLRKGMGRIGIMNSAMILQVDSYFRMIKNM